MNYLFFDIESPNGHLDSMCEFGYVLLDENFKIIKENVILINPERSFKVLKLSKEEISLKFDVKKYNESPTFDKVYDEIKSILTNKNNLIFGFSVGNDQCYVLGTSKRYKLDLFDFYCYDIQTLYCKCYKVKSIGLDKMGNELLSKEELAKFCEHYSLDDAKVTSLCFKKLLEKFNLSIGDSLKLMGMKSALQTYTRIERNREEKLDVIRKNKRIWDVYVKGCKLNRKSMYFCAVCNFVFKNRSNVIKSIRYIKEHNYIPTDDIRMADILIVSGPKEKRMLSCSVSIKNKKIVMMEEIKF